MLILSTKNYLTWPPVTRTRTLLGFLHCFSLFRVGLFLYDSLITAYRLSQMTQSVVAPQSLARAVVAFFLNLSLFTFITYLSSSQSTEHFSVQFYKKMLSYIGSCNLCS